jgi:membrane-associated phospholipid phosphatase
MEAIWNVEINFILAIQSSLIWLAGTMKGITFLGSEEFFILVMPVLYWCVDTAIGLRVGLILLLSGHLNGMFKVIFHSPRPFWYSPEIKALSAESSFGMPSGHSMSTSSVWGMAAALFKKRWFTIVSIVVIFLVGFSRIILGMHFISDVLVGWSLGLILLLIVIKLDKPVSAWLGGMSLARQIVVVILSAAAMIGLGYLPFLLIGDATLPAEWIRNAVAANPAAIPEPYSTSGMFTTAGVWLGMGIGAAVLFKRGGLPKPGSARNQLLRYLIGVVGIAVFWYGLGAVFPRGEEFLPLFLRLFRYALVGLWIGAGAPLLFIRLKLFTE